MASREIQAPDGHGGIGEAGAAALDQQFDRSRLYALRAAVAAHAADLGAPAERVAHLMIMASELASNAIQHGGGQGRLRLWRVDGALRCEVSDAGPGIPDPEHAGTVAPSSLSPNGRGLWIVRRLAGDMTIENTGRGTRVTVAVPLHPG
jgi:anti-sigma regulatory factor (Ser/Thr protein kinase)